MTMFFPCMYPRSRSRCRNTARSLEFGGVPIPEIANAPHFAYWLLCLDGERRTEEGAIEDAEEGAPIHHSIT